ncbi:MAG: FtsL-like putative cell division protein [Porphyromonadaceae bacterium]|nr:FtsL-like putative cell division protein [Porphyromonadaceae bacterium]
MEKTSSSEQRPDTPLEVIERERISQLDREGRAQRLRLLYDEDYDASGDNGEHNPLHSNLWYFVLWCIVLLAVSVSWGFHVNMVENRVVKREQFLSTLKYRHLYIKAELIEHERFSSIQKRAQDFNLELELSSVPPYEVSVPETD